MKHKAQSTKHKAETQSGFVILFTVILTSIILLMALGIASVSYKEIELSLNARDSHLAFFAADTGLECGLYYDRTQTAFGPQGSPFTSATLNCAGTAIHAIVDGVSDVYDFALPPGPGMPGDGINLTDGSNIIGCAHLTVTKNFQSPNDATLFGTRVEAKGYNVACDKVTQLQQSGSQRLVERALRATYYPDN